MNDDKVRAALQRHWVASDADDFAAEHEIYAENAVLEYPQSNERITGRQRIEASRKAQPDRKRFAVRRIQGAGDLWISELVLTYGDRPFHVVSIMEFAGDAVVRETQYFGEPFPPGASRTGLTEQMDVVEPMALEAAPRHEDNALLHLQHHDTLTGLPTRAVLADRAEMALQRAARVKSVVAVLLVEIVGFNALCQLHGSLVGDDLLRATASRLHFELRKTDTAVRLEDGQFAVLLVDLHQAEEAMQLAGKIRQMLSAPVTVGTARLSLVMRVGVASSPADGDQLLPLIRAAELAMKGVDAIQGGVAVATGPVAD